MSKRWELRVWGCQTGANAWVETGVRQNRSYLVLKPGQDAAVSSKHHLVVAEE